MSLAKNGRLFFGLVLFVFACICGATLKGQGWLSSVLEKVEPQEVAPEKVPVYGTFWSLQRTNWPPLPYNPFRDSQDVPVSYLYRNSYLLWDLEVDYEAIYKQRRLEKARSYLETQYDLNEKEVEAVLGTEEGVAWAQSGFDELNTMSLSPAYSYAPGTFYLEIGTVTNNAALTLHGTSSENLYSILSVQQVTNNSWLSERVLRGAAGQDWTETSIAVGDRTNTLFLRGFEWGDEDTTTNGLSVSLTAPADGTFYPTWPTNVTMQATASSTNGTVLGVAFYAGSMLVGFDDQSPYGLVWTNALRGSNLLTARVFDDLGGSKRSEQVTAIVDPCYPAVDVVLVVDRSGSMGVPMTKFDDARQACSNFVDYLSFPADQASLISFATTNRLEQPLTNAASALLQGIDAIPTPIDDGSGWTYMSNAIHAARVELTSVRRNSNALPVMVFLSDGDSTDTNWMVLAEADRAKTNDHIRIFTIGLGAANHSLMSSIATRTNDYFYTTNSSELSGLFAAVAARLCRTGPQVEIVWPTNDSAFLYPQEFSLLARASDADGGIASVAFYNGTQPIGMASPVTGTNLWSFSWTGAALGTNLLTAVAMDSSQATSTSAVTSVVLTHPAPSIQIAVPTNGQLFAFSPTNILLTANATASGGAVTNVQFLTNGVAVGNATGSPWQVLWLGAAAGSNYTISAIATDYLGATATGSVSITVNAMPAAAWISPTNWQKIVQTNPVTLLASASDSDGSIAGVEFKLLSGETVSGTQTNTSQWTCALTNLAAGMHAALAIAEDDRGATAASDLRLFEVTATNDPPGVCITWPTNGAVFRAGADITLTATASNAITGGIVTNVQFFRDGEVLGTDPEHPYSLEGTSWKPGAHRLVARALDDKGGHKISEPVDIVVSNEVPRSAAGFWDPVFGNPGASDFDDGRVLQYFALALDNQNDPWLAAYALGSIDGLQVNAVGRWDSSEWTQVGENSELSWAGCDVLPLDGENVMVCGNQGVMQWNGTNWNAIGESFTGKVRSLAVLGSDIYAGGSFTRNGTNEDVRFVARLDGGTNWVPVGDGLNGIVHSLAVMGGHLYAGGNFTNSGASSNIHHVARLENGSWQPLGLGVGGRVRTLLAAGGNLIAGGDFLWAGGCSNANHLARWDGSQWNAIGNGVDGWQLTLPGDDWADVTVRCLWLRGSELFVGGSFCVAGPGTQELPVLNIARALWSEEAQEWTWAEMDLGLYVDSSPILDSGYVESLALREDPSGAYDLFAAGRFWQAGSGSIESRFIARWSAGRPPPGEAPFVTITAPEMYESFTSPQSITIQASIISTSAVVGVGFYAEAGGWLGCDLEAPYEFVWETPAPGLRKVLAVATNQTGLMAQSSPVCCYVFARDSEITTAPDFCELPMNASPAVILVLTNDLCTNGVLSVESVSRAGGALGSRPCGTSQVAHDGRGVVYRTLPDVYGKDTLTYTVTNASGTRAYGSVEITVLPVPQISIDSPSNGQSHAVSAVLGVSGTSMAYDWQRPITNVTLLVNGGFFAQTTNTASFSFAWSNSAPGYYALEAAATDVAGISNRSPWVTVALTNGASGQPPVAKIMNLNSAVTTLSDLQIESPAVIREALFNLEGRAYDPDSADAVSYQVLLFRPEDLNTEDTENWNELIGNVDPFADVTPGTNKNYQGFHVGGDVGGSSGPFGIETPGDLGQLDLTAIPNGVYDLVLHVRGGTDETNAIVRVQIESQLKLGQFSFSEQDLVIPVNGIPLTVTRTYNSLAAQERAQWVQASPGFGPGWTFALNDMDVQLDEQRTDVTIGTPEAPMADEEEDDYGLPLQVSIRTGGGRNVTLTLPDGRRTTFAFKPHFRGADCQADARWEAPPGVHATLTPLDSGVINLIPMSPPFWQDGGAYSSFENHDVSGWVLETKDGTKYHIERGQANRLLWDDSGDGSGHFIPVTAYDPQPRLTKIEQISGDAIVIGSNAIQHYANGTNLTRSITFERDVAGRITAIFDPISQLSTNNPQPSVRYVYNRDTGNLIQVHRLVDRDAGTYTTNRYHYDHPLFPHYITSIEDPRGVPIARTEYGEDGRISAITDAEGNRTQILRSLTPTNAVERIIDPLGYTNTTVSDLRGNPIATTNALGGITLMAYDELDNRTNEVVFLDGQPYATNSAAVNDLGLPLVSIDALGHSNLFTWNTNGLMLSHTDAKGNTSTNFYSDNGLPTGSADAQGNTTTNIYNERSLVVASREKEGSWTTNTWDDVGNLIGTSTWGETGYGWGILSTNSAGFDLNGSQLYSASWKRVDGVWTGSTNWVLRDAMDRVIGAVDPLGHTNRTIFHISGGIEATIDKLGRATTNTLDLRGLTIATLHPDGISDQTQFNANGVATNRINRAGHPMLSIPDALNRISETIFANNATNRTVFDELGRVRFSIDARGTTNAPGYDLAGQRVWMTNALGTAQQQVYRFGFDPNGNNVTVTDPKGNTTTNLFDALNRHYATLFQDGTSNTVGFNLAGHKIAETNQDGIVTRFGVNGLGSLISVTNAFETTNQTVTRFVTDEAGNQIAQIDANNRTNKSGLNLLNQKVWHELPGGQREYFGYDAAGNQIRHTNFNGVVITNEFDVMNRLTNVSIISGHYVRITYTPTGQRETMENPESLVTFGFDVRDWLSSKTVAWRNGPEITIYYGRDFNGNVTNIWSTTPGGVNLVLGYDPLNRLQTVTANGQLAAEYGFDLNGNLEGITLGNGVTNLCQHNLLNRLTNMVWKSGATPLASFAYQLGPTGNRTNLAETVNDVSRNYAWGYDELYRLRQETISGFGTVSYSLDSVGNRTNRTGALPDQTFTYSANDWLASDSYDANGNTIGSGGDTFHYDPFNRLTNFNNSVFFGYDGDGNRITKTASGVTTYFLTDDQNPTGYAQVLEEHEASGGATNLSSVYNFGLALINQREVSGPTYYFISDGHGSMRLLTDTNAAVVNAFTFDTFGNLIASNVPPQTAHLYSGEQWDNDLGMYYLRARYYKPDLGRFWTVDTYEGNQQDPFSLHKYLYCHADPVNGIDPSGHTLISSVYYSISARLFAFGMKVSAYPRAIALAKATVTAATIGSLIVSDDARAAYLATGNPSAAATGLADDVALFVYRGGRLIQQSASTFARSAVMTKVAPSLQGAANRIRNIAPDAVVGYRGSVATGVRHKTKDFFDPNDFDLDAFIVSDQLANRIPGRWRDGRNVVEIADEANQIQNVLKEFSGYRTDPRKPFTFRVWSTEEFESIVKEAPHVTF